MSRFTRGVEGAIERGPLRCPSLGVNRVEYSTEESNIVQVEITNR
jgi:hypothetical protein